jgi:hypothetical protein
MGITDIFVKSNIYSDPKYQTILPQVVQMFSDSGIRVNAWITCFVDASGKWIDPQGTYTYTVNVQKQVPVTKTIKKWYKVKTKKWYKSRGKWKYYWSYKWKYRWTTTTTYKTVTTTETRTGYNTTHNDQVIATISDIIKKYGVNGINLDYVRYPGTAYKYSSSTAAITSFVQKVSETVKGINPKVGVSADLMPEGSVNAYYYGQDYSQLSQYLDFLVPMIYKGNYGKDTAWIGTTTKYIVSQANGKPVIVGLQTYVSDSNLTKIPTSELNQDIKAASDNGASGYALFRYGLVDGNFSDTSGISSTTPSGSISTPAGSTSSAPTGANNASTTINSIISIADVEKAANSVKSFIETNQRLPAYVSISNQQIQIPAFLKLLVGSLIFINSGSTAPIVLKDYQNPSNPSETLTSGNIQSAEYLSMARSIVSFMDSNGAAPNYAASSLGNVRYDSLVYMYSKIANFASVNGRLPNYVSMTPWTTNTAQPLLDGMSQYLQPTANCQSNNAQIIALAKSITSSSTSTYDKAVKIFNWVRDNIGYSFYYNTKYGAVGTLNSKTGNCVDTSHLLIALARAAGIPARYVHGTCKFSSGNWYGHVWADLYVNGQWIPADATSSRNSFGVINNWNTATWTLKGKYASLPF